MGIDILNTAEKTRELTYKNLEESVLREHGPAYKEYIKLVEDAIQEAVECKRFYAYVYDSSTSLGRLPTLDVQVLVVHKLQEKGYEVKYDFGFDSGIKISWQ